MRITENGSYRKYKEVIYGGTGYILAGARNSVTCQT